MMWKTVCCIILCMSVIACDSEKKDNDGSQQIALDCLETGSIILNDVDYIPLETTDQSLLGRIDKILYRKNQFYVLDKMTGGVYVFDRTGRFLTSVRKYGEGPDEYIEMMDMDVDEEGNIYIADNAKMNILRYDAPSFDFKGKYEIGNHFHEFAYLGNTSFVLKDVFDTDGLKCKLAYYDIYEQSKTPILEKTLSEVEELDIMKCSKYCLYRSGSDLFYYERFTPNVYSISETGKLNKLFELVSDKYISEADLKPLERNPMKFLQERNHIKDVISLYATDDYFVCMPFFAPSATFIFIPKDDMSVSQKVDLMKCPDFIGTSGIEGVVDNRFLIIKSQFDEKIRTKDDRLQNLNEESNPVLMLCSIKLSNFSEE